VVKLEGSNGEPGLVLGLLEEERELIGLRRLLHADTFERA
jgi:hypothetical protein